MFANPDVNRLAVHSGLRQLAWGLAGVFFFAVLLRAGLSPAAAFLAVAATLALRLATRPIAFALIRSVGVRPTMLVGSVLYAAQFPVLAMVDAGHLWTIGAYVLAVALADVTYWTCYHAVFAAAGDVGERGAQVGVRTVVMVAADAVAPVAGGLLLTWHPAIAFAAASVLALVAIVPFWSVPVPAVDLAGDHGYAPFREGVRLFATDAFVMCGFVLTWGLIMFEALDRRFDAFGWLLGAAALAGAFGGLVLGRLIDAGHAARAVRLNLVAMSAVVLLRVTLSGTPTGVVVAALLSTALMGLYVPTLMTAVYNAAKTSPCAVRFHYLAEAGWDAGGILVCVLTAGALALGISARLIMLAALPVLALQAWWLHQRYDAQQRDAAEAAVAPPDAALAGQTD
ncbi:MFS transporter [Rhodoplanes roseus]|uniref:MFS transporter n=1 Tax=Rhodoplanes roseus TaxID=29409 RepID=UPI000DAD5818|nr:MFS transporter [Rhodoplanes roseus]